MNSSIVCLWAKKKKKLRVPLKITASLQAVGNISLELKNRIKENGVSVKQLMQ